jgi:hypothetical protein
MNYSLENDVRVIVLCQFVHICKEIFKLSNETPTPADLEYALKNPETDPLCGELVSKLLSRKVIRVEDTPSAPQKYEVWNEQLGKKVAQMFKSYSKFALKNREEDGKSNESDVLTHAIPYLIKMDPEKYKQNFYNEHAGTWKTDMLQLVRLFENDLGCEDPFFIPGQATASEVEEANNGGRRKNNI